MSGPHDNRRTRFDFPCHCEEVKGRRGNLLVLRTISGILPGDSHVASPRNDVFSFGAGSFCVHAQGRQRHHVPIAAKEPKAYSTGTQKRERCNSFCNTPFDMAPPARLELTTLRLGEFGKISKPTIKSFYRPVITEKTVELSA